MAEGHIIEIQPLVAPLGAWGLFVGGVCVRAFDAQGRLIGWASEPHLT